ncbi:M48 family metallopeptidase [Candidatus Saccharibacteria bacterium]|nr:M48 family metallopeptidase [Candidatus Saccharibacteria bacterium]
MTDNEKIDAFLVRKWVWLEARLCEFKKYKKADYVRRYLPGESVSYLGRQYILDLVPSRMDSVKIDGRRIRISSTKSANSSAHNETIFNAWLDVRRSAVFKQHLIKTWEEFGYKTLPQIRIREMRKRWGSCSKDGKVITLNARLIEAPAEAIRYVCAHELAHIKHRDHNADFYRLMESHLSADWRRIKEDLEVRFG